MDLRTVIHIVIFFIIIMVLSNLKDRISTVENNIGDVLTKDDIVHILSSKYNIDK